MVIYMRERKPDWLKDMIALDRNDLREVKLMLRGLNLHSVCEGARCPNIGECFASKTATFMILGDTCTRNCRFCAVRKGIPSSPDRFEPENIAKASNLMGLKHIVVTSVTRDDLPDGGANQFKEVIRTLRRECPGTTVEVLIPDLRGDWKALAEIVGEHPGLLNHNLETVPSLYDSVRPQADYGRSIKLLKRAKEMDSALITKSGIMVGLGEKDEEVLGVMDDLLEAGCSVLTIGQYLRPSLEHLPVVEYVRPEKFEFYRKRALEKGFSFVSSGPLVRSSYHAAELFTESKTRK